MQHPSMIATWNRNPADEEAMGAAHAPIWRRMFNADDIDSTAMRDHAIALLDRGIGAP